MMKINLSNQAEELRQKERLAIKLGITVDELDFSEMVNQMPIEDRIEFRNAILVSNIGHIEPKLPMNLFFDYETQKWF